MDYNGLQTSVRKRFSNHYSFDANYTFSKAMATQGGDLAVYSLSNVNNTQDFWDPEFDRGPAVNDLRHRVSAMFIVELPELGGQNQLVKGVAGGWQVSGIVTARSGNALTITQPSGIVNSRPDIVPGVDLVDRKLEGHVRCDRLQLPEPGCLRQSPGHPGDQRDDAPGTYQVGDARSPAEWDMQHDVCEELRHRREQEIAGPGRLLQHTEQDELGQPGHGDQRD